MRTRALGFTLCVALVACGSTIVPSENAGSTGSGGNADTSTADCGGASGGSTAAYSTGDIIPTTTGTGGPADGGSVLGTTFQPMVDYSMLCQAAAAWGSECAAEGGFVDSCNNVACTGGPMVGSLCHAPAPPPAADEFACAYLNCKVGQVCHFQDAGGDTCSLHECVDPPPSCGTTPTCACFPTSGPVESCTTDSAGNITVTSFASL